MTVQAKRVYEPLSAADGRRYLVDRLWPRGLKKESLSLTGWLKELAPSPELCAWFGHKPERFPSFRERYRAELERHLDLIVRLVREARSGSVTLLFAARNTEQNNAIVLREMLEERLRK